MKNTNKEINRNKFINLIGTTEYKSLKEYPNHIITADGRIWSLSHGKFLKPSVSYQNGYYQVNIKNDKGNLITAKVHTMVANAFLGYRPNGKNVNHRNCDKLDNRIENLEYITQAENIQHALANGMIAVGDDNSNATKTHENVLKAILDVLVGNEPKTIVGGRYGLSVQYLNRVLFGKLRKQIWDDSRLVDLKPF